MVTFRASLNKQFGNVSIESDNEKEIIDNLKRLQSLGDKLDQVFGSDVSLPQNVIDKLENLEYIERILVLLNYSQKSLTRQDCKKTNKILRIPKGWWIGSNFSRDLKKKADSGYVQIIKKDRPQYRITNKGKKHVKGLLAEK